MIKKFVPKPIKNAIHYLLSIYFSGNKYICPFCHHKARKLKKTGFNFPILKEKKVIGAGLREAECYRCFSKDRERMVFLYLKHHLQIFDKAVKVKVLHIAPEPLLTKEFQKYDFQSYICGDLFTKGYTYPNYVENMNILSIPYDDNYFDLIICNHVLEHIPADKKAMQELFRVLKPNGKAILLVPISANSEKTDEDFTITNSSEKEQRFGQFDHCRIYGQDYYARLESVGFMVNRTNISHEFPNYGLNPIEEVIVGFK